MAAQTQHRDPVEIISKTAQTSGISEDYWNELVELFREACLSYHEGHESEAKKLAIDILPELIRRWSKASPESSDEKRLRLQNMFIEESRRIADAGIIQRMIVNRLSERVLPSIMNELKQHGFAPTGGNSGKRLPQNTADLLEQAEKNPEENKLMQKALEKNRAITPGGATLSTGKRKVPVGDVSGMIDALQGSEYKSMAQQISPLRSLFE